MKKTILTSVLAGMAVVAANASDGGLYTETETYTNHVRYNVNTINYVAPAPRPAVVASCNSCAKPVRVKTHTEVINHYAVYRPVTVYEPMGTYAERRVIRNNTCNHCN